MQQNSNNIRLLFPEIIDWENWKQYKPDVPFSDKVVDFLNALSSSLLKDKLSRFYPDVVTFAFFCRKANLMFQKEKYKEEGIRLGRGIIFHVAPSNVPINFGYSLVAGLLSGNYNIVRVSTKEFPQVNLVIHHIQELSKEAIYREVSRRIVLVKYDRTSDATMFLSSFCNARVIWGGDETIAQIRKSAIPPRSFDVTFSDRYSMAVINANEFIKEKNIQKIAEGFYNDTYLFDQNACSAPHLVIWLGEKKNIKEVQKIFWDAVYAETKKKYEFQSVLAVDKLTAIYRQAICMPIEKESTEDNLLIRVNLKELPKNIDDFRCAGGYFSEYVASSINEIVPIIKTKYQTLAYYGLTKEDINKFVLENHIIGLDRIVPIGATTDFALTWDGYNLINTLSRSCSII